MISRRVARESHAIEARSLTRSRNPNTERKARALRILPLELDATHGAVRCGAVRGGKENTIAR